MIYLVLLLGGLSGAWGLYRGSASMVVDKAYIRAGIASPSKPLYTVVVTALGMAAVFMAVMYIWDALVLKEGDAALRLVSLLIAGTGSMFNSSMLQWRLDKTKIDEAMQSLESRPKEKKDYDQQAERRYSVMQISIATLAAFLITLF